MNTVPVQWPIITPNPAAVQHFQKKKDLRKFFNLISWIFLLAFLPITVLIFLSQDAVPGDNFYPVKRGLENVILATVSVNPVTRTAFRTDLTEARFKEAQSLIVSEANAGGLSSFTDDVQEVQLEIASLTNDVERTKAEEKLLAKIDQYQAGLSSLQAKAERNLIAYSIRETPTSARTIVNTVSSQNQTSPGSSSRTPIPTVSLAPNKIPTPTLTPFSSSAFLSKSSPTPSLAKSDLMPAGGSSPTPIPKLTLVSTIAPVILTQQGNVQTAQQKEIMQILKEAREKLDKIKKDLEEKRGENIQKSAGSNEDNNQNKNNSNKKSEPPGRQK